MQVLILLGCLIAVSVALDFAAKDLRRFARAKQQLQRQRALRPLKRILKEIISKPSESTPRFSNYDGGSSQRVGFRQTPGPLGYLAHLLRLMSYLVSSFMKILIQHFYRRLLLPYPVCIPFSLTQSSSTFKDFTTILIFTISLNLLFVSNQKIVEKS